MVWKGVSLFSLEVTDVSHPEAAAAEQHLLKSMSTFFQGSTVYFSVDFYGSKDLQTVKCTMEQVLGGTVFCANMDDDYMGFKMDPTHENFRSTEYELPSWIKTKDKQCGLLKRKAAAMQHTVVSLQSQMKAACAENDSLRQVVMKQRESLTEKIYAISKREAISVQECARLQHEKAYLQHYNDVLTTRIMELETDMGAYAHKHKNDMEFAKTVIEQLRSRVPETEAPPPAQDPPAPAST